MKFTCYKHQSVRDLAWVISSPPLMELPDVVIHRLEHGQVDLDAWLLALDNAPEALELAISQMKRSILGNYFETLVAFWLERRPDTHIIASNLQVREDKHTIGEFDFIIEKSSAILHVEVAVKLYLQTHDSREWHDWIGPKAHDRLDQKIDKLLRHQLRLPLHPAGEKTLYDMGLKGIRSELLYKGYFFYPFEQYMSGQIVAPLHAHQDHLKGWWCRINEVEKLCDYNYLWGIPDKLSWLAPACFFDSDKLITYKKLAELLKEHFTVNDIALLLTAMTQNEQGIWVEQHRGFILPEIWPAPSSFPL